MGSSRHHRDSRRGLATDDLPRHTKYSKSIRVIGWFQVILSLVSIGVGIAILVLHILPCDDCGYLEKISPGIWCGLILFISGVLATRKIPNSPTSLIRCNIAFSILGVIAMVALFVLSFLAPRGDVVTAVAYLYLVLCGVSGFGFVFCIAHFAFCCAATCRPRPVIAVIYENPQTGEHQILYEDTKQSSFLAATPPRQQSLEELESPRSQTSFIAQKVYDPRIPAAPEEPPPFPTPQTKRKPPSYSRQVLPTIEQNYSGVMNQMAHKQMAQHGTYDNVSPSIHYPSHVTSPTTNQQRSHWQESEYERPMNLPVDPYKERHQSRSRVNSNSSHGRSYPRY